MKRCCTCKQTKPLAQFPRNPSKPLGVGRCCFPCQRAYCRDHYQRNRSSYYKRNVESRKRLNKIVENSKIGKPCMDCGRTFPPCAMDYDHRNPLEKVDCVSRMYTTGSEKKLLEEISKCDLVCAVCHRIRTRGRLQDVGSSNGKAPLFEREDQSSIL